MDEHHTTTKLCRKIELTQKGKSEHRINETIIKSRSIKNKP